MSLIVIVDTNFFIQGKNIDKLPWMKQFGEQYIKIIVCRSVITEIDRQKNDTRSRVQKRARAAYAMFGEILKEKKIAIECDDGSRVEMSFASSDCDGDATLQPDDRLIDSAKCIVGNNSASNERVVLIAHDLGVVLSADVAGIDHFLMTQDWLLEPEKTKEQKEIDKLNAQLQAIINRDACLLINISYEQIAVENFITVEQQIIREYGDEEIDIAMKLIEESFPASKIPVFRVGRGESGYVLPSQNHFIVGEWHNEYSHGIYLKSYEQWLKSTREKISGYANKRMIVDNTRSLTLSVNNIGSRIASDVQLEIKTGEALQFTAGQMKIKHRNGNFFIPAPPFHSSNEFQASIRDRRLWDSELSWEARDRNLYINGMNVEQSYYSNESRKYNKIKINTETLRHGDVIDGIGIYFRADPSSTARSSVVTIKGSTESTSSPAIEFNVRIKKHEINFVDVIERLIEVTLREISEAKVFANARRTMR